MHQYSGLAFIMKSSRISILPATYENGAALPFYSNSIYDQNRFAALSFITGKEIVMGDLETEYQNYVQNVPSPREGDQPCSLIYLPLKLKDRILGVITVQSLSKKCVHRLSSLHVAKYCDLHYDCARKRRFI